MDNYTLTTGNRSDFSNESGESGPFSDVPAPAMWGVWFAHVMTPIIVGIGIIGNAFSLLVMKSKALRHKSYSHYLCALAVCDSLTLIMRQVNMVDQYNTQIQHRTGVFFYFTGLACKCFNFVESVCYLMSSWLIVLMAIERVVAVCFPFRKSIIRKQKGAVFTICLLFILTGNSQVFRLVMIENVIGVCAAAQEYLVLYTTMDTYFYKITLTFCLPVVIILICNSSVLYQIMLVRKATRCTNNNPRYNRVVHKRHKTTFMLLTVSFTYILTLLPLFVVTVYMQIVVMNYGKEAYKLMVPLIPYFSVFEVISLINYAINFFIYILSGKSFRYELRKIFYKERTPSMTRSGTRTREEFIRL